MSDSIKPPWAIALWCNSDYIFAELPAIGGKSAHVVRVPNNGTGLSKILALAKSRDIGSKLGMKGDPTQQQISKIDYSKAKIRRVGKIKFVYTDDQRSGARAILRKMGII